ncbi:hypothetical protein RDI58_010094 [Solanum bulbocastanum]|uniref:Uncharacterized protein n=1 Tax=Solanum bulbocastanum TaxID=147425 RepID=A0AAN8TM74_SOLBU
MNIANSEKKLEGIRKTIFPEDNGVTRVNMEGEVDSYRDEPAVIQFPKNSTVPIRESQKNVRRDPMIGEYSPQLGEHLTESSTSLDGQIAGEKIMTNVAGG